ncbi:hypothetical protein DLJ53_03055 [Acuticoccus sediminis]|uniref:Uncharacterized protein n=1 Tax=Acuticoccus sediminis TaxID=2184697 RepID=A0A8B2P0J7_9HYPH|nr:hypothetical protein [Acuticoccus sediminis]RAI03494.1 hypothetical protein DLJ53_03055 [Acuticoccus sediminis]
MPEHPAGDAPAPVPAHDQADDHLDALLDEALEESFPASDPVALSPRDSVAPKDRKSRDE